MLSILQAYDQTLVIKVKGLREAIFQSWTSIFAQNGSKKLPFPHRNIRELCIFTIGHWELNEQLGWSVYPNTKLEWIDIKPLGYLKGSLQTKNISCDFTQIQVDNLLCFILLFGHFRNITTKQQFFADIKMKVGFLFSK